MEEERKAAPKEEWQKPELKKILAEETEWKFSMANENTKTSGTPS